MTNRRYIGAILMIVALSSPAPVEGQVGLGFHGSFSNTLANSGSFGVGGNVTLPMFSVFSLSNLKIMASGDYFFPDCGRLDCDFTEWGLHLVLAETAAEYATEGYLGAGLIYQVISEREGDSPPVRTTDFGVSAILGVRLFIESFLDPFVEVHYERLTDLNHWLVSAGLQIF